MKKSGQEIKNRILRMTGLRSQDKSVRPSEVTRDLFSDIWKEHLDEVRTMAGELQSEKLSSISKRKKDSRMDEAKGPVRLSLLKRRDINS